MGNIEALPSPMVQAKHVSSEYFITLVRDYERKYQVDWLTFLTDHQNSKEELSEDFADWLFLCKAYLPELVAATGPPLLESCSEKPEGDSGFCFLRYIRARFATRPRPLRTLN